MNPTILGVIGPGFLNQAPTLRPFRFVPLLGSGGLGAAGGAAAWARLAEGSLRFLRFRV